MPAQAAFEHAMLLAMGASIVTASLGTGLVFAAWLQVARRTGLPVVSVLLSVLALGAVYIGSVMVLMLVAHHQLDPPHVPGDFSPGVIFIHPGLLDKVAPLVAIVITWVGLLGRHRRLRTAA